MNLYKAHLHGGKDPAKPEVGCASRTIKKYKKGFTLAEVLVCLVVIGVTATLTIPSLISNTTDKQNLVRFKKNYSVAAQAIKQIEAENGTINFSTHEALKNDFTAVMKVIKEGAFKDLSAGYYNCYKNNSAGKEYISGGDASDHPTVMTSDGSIFRFDNYNTTNCSGSKGTLTTICGQIAIDVNGKKSPNMFGKDYFHLWIIRKNGTYAIYPVGTNGDSLSCIGDGTATLAQSMGCSKEALLVKSPDDMP